METNAKLLQLVESALQHSRTVYTVHKGSKNPQAKEMAIRADGATTVLLSVLDGLRGDMAMLEILANGVLTNDSFFS